MIFMPSWHSIKCFVVVPSDLVHTIVDKPWYTQSTEYVSLKFSSPQPLLSSYISRQPALLAPYFGHSSYTVGGVWLWAHLQRHLFQWLSIIGCRHGAYMIDFNLV